MDTAQLELWIYPFLGSLFTRPKESLEKLEIRRIDYKLHAKKGSSVTATSGSCRAIPAISFLFLSTPLCSLAASLGRLIQPLRSDQRDLGVHVSLFALCHNILLSAHFRSHTLYNGIIVSYILSNETIDTVAYSVRCCGSREGAQSVLALYLLLMPYIPCPTGADSA